MLSWLQASSFSVHKRKTKTTPTPNVHSIVALQPQNHQIGDDLGSLFQLKWFCDLQNDPWLSSTLQLSRKLKGYGTNLLALRLIPALLLPLLPQLLPLLHLFLLHPQHQTRCSSTGDASNKKEIMDNSRTEDWSSSRGAQRGIKLNISEMKCYLS